MPFEFRDRLAALDDLIVDGDPAAERLARELIADPDHHADGVAAVARILLARADFRGASLYAERLVRIGSGRLEYVSLAAAIDHVRGRHRKAIDRLRHADEALILDATALGVGLRAARAEGDADALQEFASRLARLGALHDADLARLDDVVQSAPECRGWVAVAEDGALVGALSRQAVARATLAWHAAGQSPVVTPLRERVDVDGTHTLARFRISGETVPRTGRLSIAVDGRELIGSPVSLPARAVVLGSIGRAKTGELSGWAWAPGRPDDSLHVAIFDRDGHTATVEADRRNRDALKLGCPSRHCGFRFHPERLGLGAGPLGGRALGVHLAGSPVVAPQNAAHRRIIARHRPGAQAVRVAATGDLVEEALATVPIVLVDEAPNGRIQAPAAVPPPRAVLIPVYDGRDETLACIASVRDTVPTDTRILVVDDASPDPSLSEDLVALERSGAITLLRNPENLGFPRTVNRGLAELRGCDVVLVNADALVANDWLDRLSRACRGRADVGTVTALAPSGSIASYAAKSRCDTAAAVGAIDAVAREVNAGQCVTVPTGVGHCIYLRAECLAEVGDLDDITFGRGYGEENDFCLRARALGWRNIVAADVFVGHGGERSFGVQRRILSQRNGRIIERLYPGYDAAVERHVAEDPLRAARRRIDLARLSLGRPSVLLVTMGLAGGVETHVAARARTLAEAGLRVVSLRSAPPSAETGESVCRLAVEDQPDLEHLVFGEDEFDHVLALLRALAVTRVEIHHTLHHDPRVLELGALLGVPYEVVVHDYSWICPRMSLVDGTGRYCGEPDDDACDRCVKSFGKVSEEDIPVAALRARSRRVFAGAERVVAPCKDVSERLRRYAPDVSIAVVPWDEARPGPSTAQERSGRLTVAVPGAIGLHKGFAVVEACARDAAARDLPLDFVVVGYSEDDAALLATRRVFVTGRYKPGESSDLLSSSGAEVAMLPSVCPETWSYTLSETWRSGLDILAFDLGAIGERIRAHGGGRLLPASASPVQVNDALLAWKRRDSTGAEPMISSMHDWPFPHPGTDDHRIRRNIAMSNEAPIDSQSKIGSSTQLLTISPGLYSVVVTDNPYLEKSGAIPLPALQVTTAESGEGNIEFLPSGKSALLSRPGEGMAFRVAGGKVVMAFTSLKPGDKPDATISINLQRIDVPAQQSSAASPAKLSYVPGQSGASHVEKADVSEKATLGQIRPAVGPSAHSPVPCDVMAHVQRRGDVRASGSGWAGGPGEGNWIEAISITPLEQLSRKDIEYKALTVSGVESPWVPGGELCGSRGQGIALAGIAIRLTGAAAQRYDVAYEGTFVSGSRSLQGQNGKPLRSDRIGDPLEALRVMIVEKRSAEPAGAVF